MKKGPVRAEARASRIIWHGLFSCPLFASAPEARANPAQRAKAMSFAPINSERHDAQDGSKARSGSRAAGAQRRGEHPPFDASEHRGTRLH